MLLLLKYFDVFHQRLHLVCPLMVEPSKDKFEDILYFIETRLINESSIMKQFGLHSMIRNRVLDPVWKLYEEICASENKIDDLSNHLKSKIGDTHMLSGDILVFGLNAKCAFLSKNAIFQANIAMGKTYLSKRKETIMHGLSIPQQIIATDLKYIN